MGKKYYTYEVEEKRFTYSERSIGFQWFGEQPSETKEEALESARKRLEKDIAFHARIADELQRQLTSSPESIEGIPTLVVHSAVETLVP